MFEDVRVYSRSSRTGTTSPESTDGSAVLKLDRHVKHVNLTPKV